jgi:hypothetical protein
MSKVKITKSIENLMGRASFGAPHDLLDTLSNQTYEETVEQLLAPNNQSDYDELVFFRYHQITNTLSMIAGTKEYQFC